jgi:GNAT superfamily N-acetyltransferase
MNTEQPFAWQFLGEQPTHDQLLQAMVDNTCQWVIRCTNSDTLGEVQQEGGVTWVYAPGPEGDAAILFPRLTLQEASRQLDVVMHYFRQHRPERDMLCWSLDPTEPADLEVRLLARGFEWNWQPHWMWCALQNIDAAIERAPGLHIEIVEQVPLWDVEDLPYYSPSTAAQLHRTTQQEPRLVWHFAAWLNGHVVGQSRLNLTTGELGVAGIFDVSVVPEARNKGIGKALTLAACQLARSLGCRHALLNASSMGEPVYRKLGFTSLGHGKTWLLRRSVLASPPEPQQIALVEALGRGDIARLDELAPELEPTLFSTPLPSGLTPLQIVVGLHQPHAAEWLVARGVELDVLTAWDLGWHERAQHILTGDPQQVNQRQGRRQGTPLHSAVERNDFELVALLLSANPDISLKDGDFQATALEWARFLNRTEMIMVLEHYQFQHTSG